MEGRYLRDPQAPKGFIDTEDGNGIDFTHLLVAHKLKLSGRSGERSLVALQSPWLLLVLSLSPAPFWGPG